MTDSIIESESFSTFFEEFPDDFVIDHPDTAFV